jgi:hypothetical protein
VRFRRCDSWNCPLGSPSRDLAAVASFRLCLNLSTLYNSLIPIPSLLQDQFILGASVHGTPRTSKSCCGLQNRPRRRPKAAQGVVLPAPLAGAIVLATSSLFQDTSLPENVDESLVSTTSLEATFLPRHVPKRMTAA